jgi:hypothetical protein
MVKVQRLFAKTNLKIPIYRVTKTIHPSADGPKTVVRYFYTHAAGENCPTKPPWEAHGTVNGSTAQNDSAL